MRRVTVVLVAVAVGCGRAPQPEPTPAEAAEQIRQDAIATTRETDLKKLRSRDPREQQAAARSLGKMAASDPTLIAALLEALRDKTNRGAGQVFPLEPNSVRDAAVQALLEAGPAGEAALADKGLPILLDGLKDPSPAVREHTAVAIGRMGKKGLQAVEALWPLTAEADPNVRAAAWDALREIVPTSPLPAVARLTHADEGVRRDAVAALAWLRPLPPTAAEGLTQALRQEDPLVRAAAADALADLGPAARPAIPELIELLKAQATALAQQPDDPLAFGPLRALAGVGEPAVEPVAKLLQDPEPLVRWQSAYVLGEIGAAARPAAEALEKTTGDRQGLVALEAARALAQVTGDASKSARLFELALSQPDPAVRATALQVIARTGPAGRGLAKLVIPLIGDPNEVVRQFAVEYIASLDPATAEPAIPVLAKRLSEDDNATVRQRAAQVLEDLGTRAVSAAAALGQAAAADTDDDVRRAAVATLVAIGPTAKAGLPGLTQLARDAQADPRLRAEALAALATLAPQDSAAAAATLTATGDRSPEVRAAAAEALGRFTPPSAEVITKLSTLATADRDYTVRARALKALAELGPAARAARETVAKLAGSSGELGVWGKVALARIDGKGTEALAAARAGLASRQPAERRAGAGALMVAGPPDPADLPALLTLLKDRVPEVRQAAALAVARYDRAGKEAIPRLVELMSDRDADVRLAAALALGRVGDQSLRVLTPLRNAVRSDPVVRRTAHRSLRQLGG